MHKARFRCIAAIVLSAAAIIVWSSLSYAQSAKWRDSQTVFHYTLSLNPRSLAANYVLGKITAQAALHDLATARNPGEIDAANARIDQAIEYDARALETDATFSEVLFNLANLYERTGRLEAAVDTYERAVRGQAATAQMLNNLGIALTKLGRGEEAQRAYAAALQLDPNYADAEADWGLLLLAGGDREGARRHFHRALQIRPDCIAALHGLDHLREGVSR